MKTLIIILVSMLLSGCGLIFGPDMASKQDAEQMAMLKAIIARGGGGGGGGDISADIQGMINDNMATYQLQEARKQSQFLLWMQMQGCR